MIRPRKRRHNAGETPPRAAAGPTRRSRKQGFRYCNYQLVQHFHPCHRSSASSSTTPKRTTKDRQPPWNKNLRCPWSTSRIIRVRSTTGSASSAPAVRRVGATETTWQAVFVRHDVTDPGELADVSAGCSHRVAIRRQRRALQVFVSSLGCPTAICTTTDSTASAPARLRNAAARSGSGATTLMRSGNHPDGPADHSRRAGRRSRAADVARRTNRGHRAQSWRAVS